MRNSPDVVVSVMKPNLLKSSFESYENSVPPSNESITAQRHTVRALLPRMSAVAPEGNST